MDGYSYTWLNSNVTATSDVEVEFLDGAEDADGDILSYEKVSGGIEFTCETLPTTGIPVAITIYRAKNESITDIDGSMVSTDVISGAENVDEALEALDEHIVTVIKNTLTFQNGYARLPKPKDCVLVSAFENESGGIPYLVTDDSATKALIYKITFNGNAIVLDTSTATKDIWCVWAKKNSN